MKLEEVLGYIPNHELEKLSITPNWRSFATRANFNLEHNRSVCNAGILIPTGARLQRVPILI